MKLRETRYMPKKRRNPLLKAMTAVLVIFVLVMWLNMERFGLELSDMFIASGIALGVLSLTMINRNKEKEVDLSDKQVLEMRDKIGKDEYSTSSMFYDDKDE